MEQSNVSGTGFSDFDGLAAFVAIVRHGTLTAAASALGIPKATLSRRLAALEASMGAPLMVRTTRKWSLTDFGRELHGRIAGPMEIVGDAAAGLRDAASEPAGLVRLTAPEAFGETELVPALAGFLSAHPKVRVELVLRERVVDLVAEGIDLAIRTGQLDDSTLVSRKLAENAFWFVASADQARRMAAASDADDEAEMVHVPRDAAHLPSFPLAVDGGRPPAVRWRLAVDTTRGRIEAARAGLGVALVPARLVEPLVRSGELIRVLAGSEPPPRPMTLLYPSGRIRSAAVKALSDFLIEIFG